MTIDDEPDFEYRGVMLDVSRGKVPKIEEIKKLIDLLSELKYNQLQLYFEGIIYTYQGFETHYEGKNPITALYIEEVKKHCEKRMITLVPNHNSFGHMGAWLAIEQLKSLAECPDGFDRTDEFGVKTHLPPGVLNPLNSKSLELVDRLYSDVLPNFDSDMLNVGCDEAFELGMGYSKDVAEKVGKNKIYTDYMLKLDKVCKKYGKSMMFWADMIIDDTEALKRMPKNAIPIVWGYEQEHPFYQQCKNVSECGLNFFVSPGTCAWGSMTGRSENMMHNQLSAAQNGKMFGATGYLLTDWGQEGHCQFPVISYVPFAYGAGLCWSVKENVDIKHAFLYLDKHLFYENGFSKFLYDCGQAYQREAYKRFNQTALMSILTTEFDDKKYMHGQTVENFQNIAEFLQEKIVLLDRFEHCPSQYKNEIRMNLRMAESIARAGVIKLGGTVGDIKMLLTDFAQEEEDYRKLWLSQNEEYNVWGYIKLARKITKALERFFR